MDGSLKPLSDSAVSDLELVLGLKIQPKLCGSAEVPRQSQCHFRRNRSAPPHDLIDRRSRHPELFGQLVRTQLERLHEIVKQNVARMTFEATTLPWMLRVSCKQQELPEKLT
jgi:hypothetical protein